MTMTPLGVPKLPGPTGEVPTRGPLLDTYGRAATDLRVSLTDRCNLRCRYCMPAAGLDWLPGGQLLRPDELARLMHIAITRLGAMLALPPVFAMKAGMVLLEAIGIAAMLRLLRPPESELLAHMMDVTMLALAGLMVLMEYKRRVPTVLAADASASDKRTAAWTASREKLFQARDTVGKIADLLA